MTDHANALPLPFEEGDDNECKELLRVWVTQDSTIAYSANFDMNGVRDDVGILGVALVSLTESFAYAASKNHGLDEKDFLNQIATFLREYLYA